MKQLQKAKKCLLFFLFVILTTHSWAQLRPGATKLMEIKDSLQLESRLAQLLKEGTEEDKTDVVQFYQLKQDKAKVDQLMEIIAKEHPNGEIAAAVAMININKEEDMIRVAKIVKDSEDRFDKKHLGNLYVVAADRAAKSKNMDSFLLYWGKIEDPNMKDTILKLCGPMLVQADPLKMKTLLDDKLASYDVNREGLKTYYDIMEVYADIYIALGDHAQALKIIEPVFIFKSRKSDDFLAKYANILIANQQESKAFVLIDSLLKKGKGNDELRKRFVPILKHVFPNINAGQYLTSLEQDLSNSIENHVSKEIIKEKAPDFRITDAQGKEFHLSDFKGKYLILDFWATWCGPCKASFPAMQKAVDAFKEEKDVQFLFIHTWERSKNPIQDAVEYLRDNNYRFDLFMDLKDPKTGQNPAVSAFGVTGIPAKFVIDPEGFIRYKGSGFGGGDDALVTELKAIVDYVRESK